MHQKKLPSQALSWLLVWLGVDGADPVASVWLTYGNLLYKYRKQNKLGVIFYFEWPMSLFTGACSGMEP